MPFGFNYRNVMKEPHQHRGAGGEVKIKESLAEVVTWRFVECRKSPGINDYLCVLLLVFLCEPKQICFMRLMQSLFSDICPAVLKTYRKMLALFQDFTKERCSGFVGTPQ